MADAMNAELSYVGKRLPSISAREKVVGAAKYSVDIAVPGMLVGKYLGSPHAHARIRSVDTSAAERLPGVAAVLTWKDIPHRQFNPSIQKWQHLARGTIRRHVHHQRKGPFFR